MKKVQPRLFGDNWESLLYPELESWRGTPYRHLARSKGRGADCTLFIADVLLTVGILTEIKHEYYSRDWHLHTNEETVRNGFIDHLKNHLNLRYTSRVYTDRLPRLKRGDVLGFKEKDANVTHHTSIYTDNNMMFHCLPKRGVCETKFHKYWQDTLTTIFRIYEWD